MCPHATIYVPSCYYICVFILLYMYCERQKRPSVMRAGDKSVGSIKALFRLYPGCIKGVLSLFCFYRREHWPGLLLPLRCLDVHSSQSDVHAHRSQCPARQWQGQAQAHQTCNTSNYLRTCFLLSSNNTIHFCIFQKVGW